MYFIYTVELFFSLNILYSYFCGEIILCSYFLCRNYTCSFYKWIEVYHFDV